MDIEEVYRKARACTIKEISDQDPNILVKILDDTLAFPAPLLNIIKDYYSIVFNVDGKELSFYQLLHQPYTMRYHVKAKHGGIGSIHEYWTLEFYYSDQGVDVIVKRATFSIESILDVDKIVGLIAEQHLTNRHGIRNLLH
jgi:hypothetical protein